MMRAMRVLVVALVVLQAGCQLITCDDPCGGAAGGGAAGGSATAGGMGGGGGGAGGGEVDAGTGPSSRLIDSSPWVLNGSSLVVFQNKPALNGFAAQPINHDERGFLVNGTTSVWTGATSGFVAAANCTDWSSSMTMGVIGST